jgi:LysM repeat protein
VDPPEPAGIIEPMAGRSPARFLAPIALVAFAVALFVVVSSNIPDDGDSPGARGASQPAESTPGPNGKPEKKKKRTPRTYTVKAGDTPSGIAEKNDVPLDRIFELNPDLDPQTLTPGTKIKLR